MTGITLLPLSNISGHPTKAMEGLFETEVKLEGFRNEQLLLDAEADELQRHAKNLAEEHRLSRKWRNPAGPNLVRVFPLF
ncbi:hypothetical protein ABVK25_002156 [Lepraria finkii]|uniref:Uncharacterized protein n=1 Tax=Lepraria finkii TaxID=1340010 RepID=A0ABR4BIW9_9LECA